MKKTSRKIVIDGIIHKDSLKKGEFGWYDLPIWSFSARRREFKGIVPKYFRKVHVVITVENLK